MSSVAHQTERPRTLGDDELKHPSSSVGQRVIQIMLFRLILISLVLGTTIFVSWLNDTDPSSPSSLFLFAIIAATYLLTIIYSLAIRGGAAPESLATAQLVADLVTTSLLVHLTGGAQSAYTFFFPLSIIGAASVRLRAGSLFVFAVSVVLFVGVSLLGWFEVLPAASGQAILPSELSRVELGRALALNLAAFAGIAYLSVNLGGQIRTTIASLEHQRTVVADLYTLHEDIVRCLTSGLITVDTQELVLTINQAACDILQTTARRAAGSPVDTILPGLATIVRQLPHHGTAKRTDLTVDRGQTGVLILGISVSPLHDNRDRVIGRIINFQDLTDLRVMEQQIKQAERLAAIGTLAAGVAHEIRNPLASISGSIELLNSSPEADEDNRHLMGIVTREIDRLNGMIQHLLDYTNPRPPRLVEFDVIELIKDTVRVIRQDQDHRDINLNLRAEGPQQQTLSADPSKLRQVLWNLVLNAAQAAAEGGGNVDVRVSNVGDDELEIEIRDDGPGIDPERIDQVFDPFFTTKARGTGLGLAVCHSIISEHRGTIGAENVREGGCRFWLRLPLGPTGLELTQPATDADILSQ